MVRVTGSVGWELFTMSYSKTVFSSSFKYTLHIVSHLLPNKWNLFSKFASVLLYRELKKKKCAVCSTDYLEWFIELYKYDRRQISEKSRIFCISLMTFPD